MKSDHPIESDSARSLPQRSWRRPAIVVSIVFHLALVAVLFFWYLPDTDESVTQKQPVAARQAESSSTESAVPKPPAPSPEVPAEQIQASIDAQREQFEKLSDERKLSELEKNLKRLEAISSEQSVQEVTAAIAGTLGLEPGHVPKEDAAEGEFDTETAQLHDVTRTKNEAGRWQYESILVDSQGRTQKVPLTEAEGEPVFEAFQQMKRFPMAAGIYRQVVMPLIQKTIEASEVAEQAAAEAERMQREGTAAQADQEQKSDDD